jgi:hypothetical protein
MRRPRRTLIAPALVAVAAVALAAAGAGPAPAAPQASAAAKLPIVKKLIPYPESRKNHMAAYSQRHYGDAAWALPAP